MRDRTRCMFAALLCVAAMAATGELLSNASFESDTLDGWTVYSKTPESQRVELQAARARTGKQAVKLSSTATAGAYHGLFQQHAVAPSKAYRFAVHAMNDGTSPLAGSTRGQISIEWMDSSGKEIDRVWGPDWAGDLSPQRWSEFEMTATAPAGAASAHFVITLHEGPSPETGGCFVDDASATEVK